MNNPIIIAVDAMGGDNSPDKVIEGISIHSNYSNDDISKIIRTSTKKKLSIVCTEKDYIKIPQKFKKFINVAYLEINIFSSKKLIELINRKLIKIWIC